MTVVNLGPSIGEHRGKTIPAHIVTKRDGRLEFRRVAIETDGGVELSQLAKDECVIAPGLIYGPATPRKRT